MQYDCYVRENLSVKIKKAVFMYSSCLYFRAKNINSLVLVQVIVNDFVSACTQQILTTRFS